MNTNQLLLELWHHQNIYYISGSQKKKWLRGTTFLSDFFVWRFNTVKDTKAPIMNRGLKTCDWKENRVRPM